MVRASTEKTLLNIGIIGALAAAAYFVYVTWVKRPEISPGVPAPPDAYDPCAALGGLPKWLCMFGDFILGYKNCEPYFDSACADMGGLYDTNTCMCSRVAEPTPLPRDDHGCLIDTQQWCPNDNQCRDVARACTPDVLVVPRPTVRPECYEWDPSSGTWQWSDSYCPYVPTPPVPPHERTKQCPDGQYYYPEDICPPYVPPVATKSCTCGGIIYEVSEAEAALYAGCGAYCDHLIVAPPVTPVTPDVFPCDGGAILWKCPTGWRNLGWMEYGYCCKPQ